MPHSTPLPIAVLISGGGTTLRNILQKIAAGDLNAAVKLVISSTPAAAGLRFAAEASIPVLVLRYKDFPTPEAYRDAVFQPCREAGVQLVVMGGFLKHVLIPPDFEHCVMNIHPGLIPAFCGQGFYGHHVHQAALDYGVKLSGCTVHFADNQYDHGPIILQRAVPVLDDDTSETLAARIFQQECEAYPEAIRLFAEGRLQVDGRRVRIS
ncbi:MAG: phosphoribosylglycinamide formyltransferase [Candidatus Anammoximicrobium sp.]|nr:phosphoribosylglycinamide formyltransferase [Candidatus Anammoximicrobium sp.]